MILNRGPIGTSLSNLADVYIFENPPKYWDELLAKMTTAAKTGHRQIVIDDEDTLIDIFHNVDQYETLCKIETIKFDFDEDEEYAYFGW